MPSHCLLDTNLTIARIEKQRHEISAAFVDASKGCNFSFSEAGHVMSLAFLLNLGMPVEFNYCGMLGNVNLWIRVF